MSVGEQRQPGYVLILVSGAAQGIGRYRARHFLEKGQRVFILDVNEDELKYTATSTSKPTPRISDKRCEIRGLCPRSVKQSAKQQISLDVTLIL